MTKREYAEAIAVIVNGEVREVEKANGVKLIGVSPKGDMEVKPHVYIETMYDEGYTVDRAAEIVENEFVRHANDFDSFNPNDVSDFNKMRPLLRARLYNQQTNAEVYESAEQYGFDDLIIVPYLELTINGQRGGATVTNALLKAWGIKKHAVINAAKTNSERYSEFSLRAMEDILREINGEDFPTANVPMYVVTNRLGCFGAFGVIALADEIRKQFPDGYAVIPSSVHEVIVIPSDSKMYDDVKNLIGDVNTACVEDQEVLGWKPYFFN